MSPYVRQVRLGTTIVWKGITWTVGGYRPMHRRYRVYSALGSGYLDALIVHRAVGDIPR